MIPGMNPRQMQSMMKKMGIQQVDIPASRVIIQSEGKNYIIENPSVQRVNMMGQDTFQITGDVSEETHQAKLTITNEDIQTVRDQTQATREQAIQAITDAEGDLAQAILQLTEQNDEA
ncbi:MAG: nascent polypeptide-associated complex protein [Candidatus Woesearchaeota archaeon]